MNITPVLKLAIAFVAFSISAHAAEIFSVSAIEDDWPTAKDSADFNALDENDVPTNQYNIYGTIDSGVGSGWGSGTTYNFDGVTAVSPGDQSTAGSNTTTYLGPKFYAGINRDVQQLQAGVIHSYGNGYRIRCNNITAEIIANNGGVSPSAEAVFMFDVNTSSLSGEGDSFIFEDSDTITAKLAIPAQMGPVSGNRASAASYRAMVKANGEYYAGTLYNVNFADIESTTLVLDMTESCATATWTLMPNMEVTGDGIGAQNLTVDTSESATTVPGIYLTNITQVGFLLSATAEINTGGFNYGVREFIAQATPASTPDPIEWSQDFTSPLTILDGLGGLTGDTHAYTWSRTGGGLASAGSVTQDTSNNQAVLSTTGNGSGGEIKLHMVGPGTNNARRVKPVSHETTWEIDLIAFKDGDADLMLQTRGFDGYVKSTISPSGLIKYTTWMSNYTHTNFDNFSGPSKLRNNTNNPGIVIVDGGAVDPASTDPVTITISGDAEGTVVLNTAGDAVESVTITNFGSGYTALPTLTWTGMSVDPTVSFNFETENVGGNIVQEVDIALREDGTKNWQLLADGQILTYIQSYDNADDSVSYYYSLTDKATGEVTGPTFITTLTAANDSAGGLGFFDFSTGNRWGTPNNQDAVVVHYKRYGQADAAVSTVGINSISVVTSDDDRDGVINRLDEFPTNPFESVDADSDGVGDNSDQHPGYNDAEVAAINTAAQSAGDSTFSYYVTGNADNYSYSVGGGAITQEAYDTAVAAQAAAVAAQATAETALANAREARAGSTVIDVANDVATITLTVEQTSDVNDWSSGTSSDYDIQLSAPAGASFYRFTIPE
jgi:hypothetical protein